MFLFEGLLGLVLIIVAVLAIFTFIGVLFSKKNRGGIFKKFLYLLVPLLGITAFFLIFAQLEPIIYEIYGNLILLVFEVEFVSIIILQFTILFSVRKHPTPPYIIYLVGLIGVIALHVILAGMMGDLIRGTVISLVVALILFLSHEHFRGKFKSLIHSTGLALRYPLIRRNGEVEIAPIDGEYLKNVKFWQARVQITQSPLELDQEDRDVERTWLKDFFPTKKNYGLEIVSHNDFRWTFFVKARSRQEASRQGTALLESLKQKYKGISGEAQVAPIMSKTLYQKKLLFEVCLPKPPFLNQVSVIKKIISLFKDCDHETRLYILWKRANLYKRERIKEKIEKLRYEDDDVKSKLLEMWQTNPYMIKIFIYSRITTEDPQEVEEKESKLEGLLETFVMDVESFKGKAYFKKAPFGAWLDILKCNIYSGNTVTQRVVDFDFPKDIPLDKGYGFTSSRIKNIARSVKDEDAISLGKKVIDSAVENRPYIVDIDTFATSCIIAGNSKTGKTYLLASIHDQIAEKRKSVGQLIINIGKENQENLFKDKQVLKFGDSRLKVPYCVLGKNKLKSIQECSQYLAAVFGMTNVVPHIFKNRMEKYFKTKGHLPKNPRYFYQSVFDYIEKHPYHSKYQQNLLQALRNRIDSIFSDDEFLNTIEFTLEEAKWYQEWKKGKNYYLDLSMCDKHVKRFLVMGILQMVRALFPEVEAGKLKNLIIIDEAHQLFEKSKPIGPYDDEAIASEETRKIISMFLKEFRWKGIGVIFVDQDPSELFQEIPRLPILKIVFRVGDESTYIFSKDHEIQDAIMHMENRYAYVSNGDTGDELLIYTDDYEIPKKLPDSEINLDIEEIRLDDIQLESSAYKSAPRARTRPNVPQKKKTVTVKKAKNKKQSVQNRKEIILKKILNDPNFLCAKDVKLIDDLMYFLAEKAQIYKKKGMIREKYCVLYALWYQRLREIVERELRIKFDRSLNFYDFVWEVYSLMEKKGITFEKNAYPELMTVKFMHSSILKNVQGIEEAFENVKEIYEGILHEIYNKFELLNDYQNLEVTQ